MKTRRIIHTTLLFCFLTLSLTQAQYTYVLADENPFAPVTLSHFGAPALGDIDGDGDLDLFVGQYNSNTMLFYRNVGTAAEPAYAHQTGDDNPLDIYSSNSGCNAPVLVDIDADDDLDVFVGIYTYIIRHLRNDGDAQQPDFVWQTGGDNPLDNVMTEGICVFPAFVDLDHDMDLDVFISDGDGTIRFYRNNGDETMPVFEHDSSNNVFSNLMLDERTKLAFHDVNGDSHVDVVISQDGDMPHLLYYQNTGIPGNPVFEQKTGTDNPFAGITGPEALVPVFADIDDDGDKDLIVGTWFEIRLYKAEMISSTNAVRSDNVIELYPNPANNDFTVRGESIHSIEVIDQLGRLIRHIPANGDVMQVRMDEYREGLYFVRVMSASGPVVQQIIIQ